MAPTSFRGDQKIRVFLADSSRIHTYLLAEALRHDGRLDVIGSATSADALVAEARRSRLDVVIISSNLDDEPSRGFAIVRELRASDPRIRAVMLLDCHNRETILEAFRAGARGIFSRSESVESLCKCIHCVHEGQVWATGDQMAYALEALVAAPMVRATDAKGMNLLSKRELEVVQSLAEGLTNREIAEHLNLSQHTVKNYLFRVFEKLGVTSRVELLFMTMSQAGKPSPSRENAILNDMPVIDTSATVQRGAEDGFLSTQMILAQMYRDGRGVPKDPLTAYMWYLICEESNEEMREQLIAQKRNLTSSMTAEQVTEAQKRASQHLKTSRKTRAHLLRNGLTQVVACAVCAIMMGLF